MNIKESPYFNQAKLLLQMLPFILKEDCFALKGGTAINLFFRDMPRLSVDIDLTYLPIEAREISLINIGKALVRIAQAIRKNPSVNVQESKSENFVSKLIVRHQGAQIKVEPNTVIRGVVFPYENRELCARAQNNFEMFVNARTVSMGDVYGGKICAALDRQHPRDLYDVKFLLDNEGITEQIRKGFIVYLLSHDRPIHELIDPVMRDFKKMYETEFQGMIDEVVSYDELVKTRLVLVEKLKKELTIDEKKFLLSFKSGSPNWQLLGVKGVENLPAVQWKQQNIQNMKAGKKGDFLEKLRKALE